MRSLLLLAGTLLVAACSASSERLECPQPHVSGSANVARETPAGIAAAGARLAHGGENAITEIAGEMRARQSGIARGEIVNYLVTAYCPEVNRRGELDKAAKHRALDAFASRADTILARR